MTGRKQIFYHTVKRSHHNTVFRQDDHAFAQHLGGECLITTFTQRLNGARQGSCNFHFLKSHCGLFSSRGTLFLILFPLFCQNIFTGAILIFISKPSHHKTETKGNGYHQNNAHKIRCTIRINHSQQANNTHARIAIQSQASDCTNRRACCCTNTGNDEHFNAREGHAIDSGFRHTKNTGEESRQRDIFELLVFGLKADSKYNTCLGKAWNKSAYQHSDRMTL